jgi:hypothetical protein
MDGGIRGFPYAAAAHLELDDLVVRVLDFAGVETEQ